MQASRMQAAMAFPLPAVPGSAHKAPVSSPVPLLSLADGVSDGFARAIGRSFRTFGFAMVTGHGIDDALVSRGWAMTRDLFAMPLAAREACARPEAGGQRGYTGFGVEIAKGGDRPDLKEFWHVGREGGSMPENIWPPEIAGFREAMLALYAALERTGTALLGAIAIDLGLPRDWFDSRVEDGDSILRLLHYPPLAPGIAGLRAAAHEDINLITLLLGAEERGLQILARDGAWIDIAPPPGALVVNVGDMLQRLTNHVLPSTSHRVINPEGEGSLRSRYSMPFFVHLRGDVVIDALPQCLTADNPRRDPPITAGAYLAERLREIGLVTAS